MEELDERDNGMSWGTWLKIVTGIVFIGFFVTILVLILPTLDEH